MINKALTTVAVALLASAGAQTWSDDLGTYQLRGCYIVKDGVRCDLSFTLTAKANEKVFFNVGDFEAVSPAGTTVNPAATSAGGGAFQGIYVASQVSAYKGVPIPLAVVFDLPTDTRSLRVLAVKKVAATNVPVASSAGAARPNVTTPAPSVQVPTGFSLDLSNCKVNTGVYTCTATLTPTR